MRGRCWGMLALLAGTLLSLGCGPSPESRLVGKWQGKIEVDEAAVDARLEKDGPFARAMLKPLLTNMAQNATFDVEFRDDGTHTSRFKLGPVDKTQSGTWKVKAAEGDRVTLTLVEDGRTHDETLILGDKSFTMEAPGEAEGLAKVRFTPAES